MKFTRLLKIAKRLAWVHNKFAYCDNRSVTALEEIRAKIWEVHGNEDGIDTHKYIEDRLRTLDEHLSGIRHQSSYIGWSEEEQKLLMGSNVDPDMLEHALMLGILAPADLIGDIEEAQAKLKKKLDLLKTA